MKIIFSLKNILSTKHYNRFWIIAVLMLISVILELLGIGAIIPIIKSIIGDSSFVISIFDFTISLSTYSWLIILVIIFIIKNSYLSFFNYYSSKFIHDIQVDLSSRLYSEYLELPFSNIKKNNSSFYLRNIISEVNSFSNTTQSIIILITEILVFISILIFLFFVEPFITLSALIYFSFFGALVYIFFKERSYKWGKIRQESDQKKIRFVQESFDGISEIKIYNLKKFFYKKFYTQIFNSSKMALLSSIASFLPRYIFEILTIVFVSFVLILLKYFNFEVESIIITLGLLGVSIFRMLPSMNKILVSSQLIKYNLPVIELLQKEINETHSLNRKKKIENSFDTSEKFSFSKLVLKDLDFKYSDEKIFEKINFKISINQSIGLIGESGSGKSTLINIISGLLKPHSGEAYFEDNANNKISLEHFTKKISYVPQNIFILEDTIKNNIILDKKFDQKLFDEVVKYTKIEEFIKVLKENENSLIGERGSNISGGQKQRIGLARALYSKPNFLILDEATNALDEETERLIFANLKNFKQKITMLIVTHNRKNLFFCDEIFSIKNKKLNNEV